MLRIMWKCFYLVSMYINDKSIACLFIRDLGLMVLNLNLAHMWALWRHSFPTCICSTSAHVVMLLARWTHVFFGAHLIMITIIHQWQGLRQGNKTQEWCRWRGSRSWFRWWESACQTYNCCTKQWRPPEKSSKGWIYPWTVLAQPIVADRGLHHLSFGWNLFVPWFKWFLFVPLVLALLLCSQYSSNRWCEQMLISQLWYLSRWQLNLPLYLQYHQEQKSCSRWVYRFV